MINELKRALAQIFVYSLTAKGSALGDGDQVESSDDAKAPGAASSESKPQRQPVRIQPFGFRSVQPKGIRGLTLRLGASNLFFVGIGPTKSYGPTDLDVGEVALYNSISGTVIKLGKDGSVKATDKAGASITMDGSGNITAQAAAPNGTVQVTATPVTGAVKLGPVGNLAVLVQGAFDSYGVPVTQAPAALLTIVKAG